MLRKRTRSHQKDQHMGHWMSDVSDSHFQCEALGQKPKTSSYFNLPGVFVGFSTKVSESDSAKSPTSPLDFRVFSNLGSPFTSPKSSHEGNQKSWDCSKVGLSIINSLDVETKSGKILLSSDSKNILFGPQMRIRTPNVRSRFDYFEAPKSLPKNYALFPSKQIKPSNLQTRNSEVQFEIGEAPLEPELFGKFRSFSLDSGDSSGSRIINCRSNLSSRNFCLENGTKLELLPNHFTGKTPKFGTSLGTKLISIPVPSGSDGLIGSFSASEIELSEDYTCVRKHGPNPQTTHIFGDCILECHNNELTDVFKNEEQEIASSPVHNNPAIHISNPSNNFLSFCYSCKKKLEGKDIYMYRGEKAFCSWDCRSQEISVEEAVEKSNNNSSENLLESNSCEEISKTGMFIAT